MGPTFRWEKSTQRYRYTSGDRSGQFVSFDQIESVTADYQEQQKAIGQGITDKLINGEVNTAEWMREQAAQLKQAHINMHGIGIGGHANFNPAEYGSVGGTMRRELGFLRGFAQDIQDGKLSEAQIRARQNLYYQNLWRTYENARERAATDEGYTWERRYTTPGEICPDCVGYAAQGWVTIGTLPNPGDQSVCLSNCRCHKRFARGSNRPTNSLLDHSFGWTGTPPMETMNTVNTETSSTPTLNLDDAVAIAQKFNPNVSRQDVEDIIAQMGEDVEIEPEAEVTASTMQYGTEVEGFYWGEPNAEDLALIEEHTGFNWQAGDWFMIPMRVADNLLWSSDDMAWHQSVLEQMTLQLPSQPLRFDHNSDIAAGQGFFLRSAMLRGQSISEGILDSQGRAQQNTAQIRSQGWLQVYVMAAISAEKTQLIHDLKTMQIADVSTGSILLERNYICPHCSAQHGREVSFMEQNARGDDYLCPHSIPTYWGKALAAQMGIDANFADYAILSGNGNGRHYETSLVGVGNLASAEVLRPVR